jgi:hypothetical protein
VLIKQAFCHLNKPFFTLVIQRIGSCGFALFVILLPPVSTMQWNHREAPLRMACLLTWIVIIFFRADFAL